MEINNQNKGAVGELMVAARLMILGHDAAITNFTVKNSKTFDLFWLESFDFNKSFNVYHRIFA